MRQPRGSYDSDRCQENVRRLAEASEQTEWAWLQEQQERLAERLRTAYPRSAAAMYEIADVALADALGTFDRAQGTPFDGYLWRLARRKAVSTHRRQRLRQTVRIDELFEDPVDKPQPREVDVAPRALLAAWRIILVKLGGASLPPRWEALARLMHGFAPQSRALALTMFSLVVLLERAVTEDELVRLISSECEPGMARRMIKAMVTVRLLENRDGGLVPVRARATKGTPQSGFALLGMLQSACDPESSGPVARASTAPR